MVHPLHRGEAPDNDRGGEGIALMAWHRNSAKANQIRDFLRADPNRMKWTGAAIAKECGCSIGLVHRIRKLFDPTKPVRGYTRRKPLIRGAKAKCLPPPSGETSDITDDPFMSI